jgi:Zn finger protein HypA/HybF involved in hydrogenase expression
MSLAENMPLIEDAAYQRGFTRVKTVWLEIGQLAAWNRNPCVSASTW